MTPFVSVAMHENVVLLNMARCRASVFGRASLCGTSKLTAAVSGVLVEGSKVSSIPSPDRDALSAIGQQAKFVRCIGFLGELEQMCDCEHESPGRRRHLHALNV